MQKPSSRICASKDVICADSCASRRDSLKSCVFCLFLAASRIAIARFLSAHFFRSSLLASSTSLRNCAELSFSFTLAFANLALQRCKCSTTQINATKRQQTSASLNTRETKLERNDASIFSGSMRQIRARLCLFSARLSLLPCVAICFRSACFGLCFFKFALFRVCVLLRFATLQVRGRKVAPNKRPRFDQTRANSAIQMRLECAKQKHCDLPVRFRRK